jgi:hypothetical protein
MLGKFHYYLKLSAWSVLGYWVGFPSQTGQAKRKAVDESTADRICGGDGGNRTRSKRASTRDSAAWAGITLSFFTKISVAAL